MKPQSTSHYFFKDQFVWGVCFSYFTIKSLVKSFLFLKIEVFFSILPKNIRFGSWLMTLKAGFLHCGPKGSFSEEKKKKKMISNHLPFPFEHPWFPDAKGIQAKF